MLARPDERPGLAIVVEAPDVRLRYVLEPLAIGVKGLRSLVVGDRSGLPIAWVGRGPKTLAATAMATRTLSAAQKVTTALDLPSPEAMRIEAGPWLVLVQSLGSGFTLSSVFPASADVAVTRDATTEGARMVRELPDEFL